MFFISRWFLQFQHVDPVEAVCIHEDLQFRHSLGIHWGTFPTGKEVCYSCTNGHVTCIFLLGIFCRGVPPGSPNPDPISDQNMLFATPIFRPGL